MTCPDTRPGKRALGGTMSESTPPEPDPRAFRFSFAGPVLAAVTTPNGTVDIRNSTGSEAIIQVAPLRPSVAGQAEAAALAAYWMRQGHKVTDADVLAEARPECRFDIPVDVATAHPMHVQVWLPEGSQFSVGTERATVSARGSFEPSRVTSEAWGADVELRGTDEVTTRWAAEASPARTVLRVEGTSGTVTVNSSGCDVAVNIDGPTTVRNVNGDVETVNTNAGTHVENVIGNVRAQSDTGDLTAKHITGRLDFHTTSGKRDALNIGKLGDYVRLDNEWNPMPPAEALEKTISAVVSAAEAALAGAEKQQPASPSDAIDLPLGKEGKGRLRIALPGHLPPERGTPKRSA